MQQKMEQHDERDLEMKEQLNAVEVERDRAFDELREMKLVAQEANLRLSEALSAHNVMDVQSQLDSVNELLINAQQELRIKEENIDLLKVDVGKAKALELKLVENVENAEAAKKALLSRSEKQIKELKQKLEEHEESSEFKMKALLSEKDERIRVLELKLAVKIKASEAQKKALLAESAEKIRKMEITLAKNAEENEAQLKALYSQCEERIRELEADIDQRRTSEANILDSLITKTNQLEETKRLLEESKDEIDALQRKMEEESVQSSELSLCHFQDSNDSMDDIESLKSELHWIKESLKESKKNEQIASSKADILNEEIRALKYELKMSTKAEENGKKAMDDFAMVLKEVATEAIQLKEELQMTKDELEKSKAEEEHLRAVMKTNEDGFKVQLDQARKEVEKYKNTAARLKIEHEESIFAWSGKETCFVDCIRIAEEDRQHIQQENFRLHELIIESDTKAMLSKEENSKLRDILKQALNEANIAKEAAAIARLDNSQLKDTLEEKEQALKRLTQESEKYKMHEIAANENIMELKRQLFESSQENMKEEKEKPPLKDAKAKESKKEHKEKIHTNKTPPKDDISHHSLSDKEKEKEQHGSNGTLLGKVFSFSLRELKVSHAHDNHAPHAAANEGYNEDEIQLHEALKDSVFEVQSPGSAHHHRRTSSTFTDDGELLHPDDFDHLDGTHAENSRKKKALLRRFGDLIKRSTAYSYSRPSTDPKKEQLSHLSHSSDANKEPTRDLKKDISLDPKKETLPE